MKLTVQKFERKSTGEVYKFLKVETQGILIQVKEISGKQKELLEVIEKGEEVESTFTIGYLTAVQVKGEYYVIKADSIEGNKLIQMEE